MESQVLLSVVPAVTYSGSVGAISAFEFDSLTNKLYIAGEFDQVGTFVRNGFAVIDVITGTVLNDFTNVTIDHNTVPTGLLAHKHEASLVERHKFQAGSNIR